jgi:para-nitrobenzyl esterase
MYKKIALVIVVLLVVFGAWKYWPAQPPVAGGPPTDVLQTSSGLVRGFLENGLNVFLGIPYAESPALANRFLPPVAHKPWSKTLDAYAFGSFCPQVYDPVEIDDPKEDLSNEDCLTLNIWTPAPAPEKRAVMVFIHGGGYVVGGSKERFYYGDALATKGDVVVVTFNYRIGLLGFFDMSGIGGSKYNPSADAGIMDQLLALKWVKENISAFGGDPDNITVFGESAGAGSAKAMLGVDQPGQYFNRMIVMSGSPLHTKENTSGISSLIISETGIKWPALWKYMPTGLLMYIQDKLLAAVGSPLSDLLFGPTYGSGLVAVQSPLEAVATGNTRGIDLMIGTMADEMTYWSFYDTKDSHICEQTISDNLFTMVDPSIKPKIQELYDLYSQDPLKSGRTQGEYLLAMGDDYAFRVDSLNLASAQAAVAKTYVYRFNYPVNLPDQPCQNNRSPHGSELPFLFGRINEQTGYDFIGKPRDAQDEAERQHLMDQMILAWTNFAKTGDPNGGDLPEWPQFDSSTKPTMVFSGDTHLENAPFEAEYQAMNEFMKTFSVFDALK